MIFLELCLENFGSYHGHHTLDLRPQTTDQGTRPIILIGGLNGGGKTTLMDAIRLALYGSRAQLDRRKKKQSYSEFLSQCVCHHAADDAICTISLTFQHVIRLSNIDKLAEIRVQRAWTRKGKDTLQVLLDGWEDRTLTETWDERVESWLPLGLSNLFLFDGEQIKELAEQDEPPPSVIRAIRAVLGLELVDRLSQHIDILVTQTQKDYVKASDRQVLDAIEQRLNQQKADLETELDRCQTLQVAEQEAEKQLDEAMRQFDAEGGTLAETSPQLQDQLNALQTQADHHRQNLRHLAGDILPLALIQPLLQSAAQQAQAELHCQQAQAAQDLLTEHHQRLQTLLQTLKLNRTQAHQLQAFLHQEHATLSAAATTEIYLHADADTLNHLTHTLTHLPSQLHLAHTHLTHLKPLTTQIAALTLKLQSAPSPADYDRLRFQRDQAQQHYEECKFSYELSKRRCRELQQAIEITRLELKRYGEQHLTQKDSDDFFQSAERVQAVLQQLQSRLALQKLNDLESHISNYFRCLLHKSNLVHRVMLDPQTFSLTLYNSTGQPIPKHRLSAGERQLLAIAFLWALATVSKRQIPIAIDTPLSRLDSDHRRNLIDQYFPSASHQMILLSTDTEVGREEVEELRRKDAIAREYLLKYNSTLQQTAVESGYFC